jgi:SAM-dependent methyltransferase
MMEDVAATRHSDSFFARLRRLLTDPARLRKAIYGRLRPMPYRLGISSIWPGTFVGYLPDRYSDSYAAYVQSGGTFRHDSVRGFFKGNQVNNRGDLARFYFLNMVCDQILKEGLRGDVAELGVYKGNTAFLLAELARKMGATAYLLDTFAGFSEDDLRGVDANLPVQFSDTSLAAVQSLVGTENVRFIQGYFPDSASQMPADLSLCLVHLDCDLYAPFQAALRYFYPRMVPGGFLILHDYANACWSGAEKAVDEFLADKPERVIPIPDKSGTAVLRKI